MNRTKLTLVSSSPSCATGSADASVPRLRGVGRKRLNNCSLSTPCRLLPRAAQTDINGEIWMLDSANYNTGTVVINKSVTILAIPGAVGSVVAQGGGDAFSVADPASR
jgi:hypothetical protein